MTLHLLRPFLSLLLWGVSYNVLATAPADPQQAVTIHLHFFHQQPHTCEPHEMINIQKSLHVSLRDGEANLRQELGTEGVSLNLSLPPSTASSSSVETVGEMLEMPRDEAPPPKFAQKEEPFSSRKLLEYRSCDDPQTLPVKQGGWKNFCFTSEECENHSVPGGWGAFVGQVEVSNGTKQWACIITRITKPEHNSKYTKFKFKSGCRMITCDNADDRRRGLLRGGGEVEEDGQWAIFYSLMEGVAKTVKQEYSCLNEVDEKTAFRVVAVTEPTE